MLERYLNKDLIPVTTTELAEVLAITAGVIGVYQSHGATPPEAVSRLQADATKVFAGRVRDELQAKREEILRRIDGLQTPAERRRAAEAELALLERQLKA